MSRSYSTGKRDSSEKAIVEALEAAGYLVYRELPCDLLVFKAGRFQCLEVKSPRNRRGDPRHDKRQEAQTAFLALTGTPVAVTAEAALRALGAIQ
jgi:hypothetical protein